MTTQTNRPEAADTLDTSGLLCPLPVYKAAMALGKLEPGQVLRLVCTDPGSLADIPAMARQRGDALLGIADENGTQSFWIQKGTGV
jgi:tRNA 2-thiouridine synthesizing protein A